MTERDRVSHSVEAAATPRPTGASAAGPPERTTHGVGVVPDVPLGARYDNLLALLEKAGEPLPEDLPVAVAGLPKEPDLPPADDVRKVINLIPSYRAQLSMLQDVFAPLIRDVPEVWKVIYSQQSFEGRSPHQADWYFRFDYVGEESLWWATHRGGTPLIGSEAPAVAISLYCHEVGDVRFFPVWRDDPLGLAVNTDPDRWMENAYRRLVERMCESPPASLYEGADPEGMVVRVKRLVWELLRRHDAIDRLSAVWPCPEHRLWLAAQLGDWPAAHAAALHLHDPALEGLTGPRAAWWLEQHLYLMDDVMESCLETLLGTGSTVNTLLGAQYPPVTAALRKPPLGGLNLLAMQLVLGQDMPGWETEAVELLHEIEPPEGACWQLLAARYLLRRGVKVGKVLAVLRQCVGRPPKTLGGWDMVPAQLLAPHDPERSARFFQEALGSPVETVSIEAIAALMVLDRPWAKALLQDAANQLRSPLARDCCHLALQVHRAPGLNGCATAAVTQARAARSRKGMLRIGQVPSDRLPPDQDRREYDDITLTRRSDGRNSPYLRYYGTVEEYFEGRVEEAREWLVDGKTAGPS